MGNFIDWSNELSVGIEEIDEQHKVLVKLVNRMHEAIQEQRGSHVVGGILEELTDYTRIHFAVEESLMRILDYPGYEEHRDAHDELLQQVKELNAKVSEGKASISFELMHFLKNWLTQHIQEEDMNYTGFFLAAGARPKSKKKSWIQKLWG
ncbi:MAG: bacteriohemerythrin [Gammaproteobacteria bacterium]|nr:bacteriohemerythrin [Gammaproteobacteria bacterium]